MSSYKFDINNAFSQVFRAETPENVASVVVTKLKLFFQKKSSAFGIEVFLTELDAGLPDPSRVLAGSRVILDPEDVLVSEDASAGTDFVFSEPVLLDSGRRYAFMVKPVGNTPDYAIWTAEQGTRDIGTGRQISTNPLAESAYFAKSSSNWTELPSEDIKFILYRASFAAGSVARVSLRKEASEFMRLDGLAFVSGRFDVRPGDEVYKFENGVANTAVRATVAVLDPDNGYLHADQSTGLFSNGDNLIIIRTAIAGEPTSNGSGVLGYATLAELVAFESHAVAPKIGLRTLSDTSASFRFQGVANNGLYQIDSQSSLLVNNEELEFQDKPRYILSKSTERVSIGASNTSVRFDVSLGTNSNWTSPIIDLQERQVLGLKNDLGSDFSGETGDGGMARSRYISRVITLADGMEAEDLKVFLTAYKPPRSIIKVYAKLWNAEDPSSFDSRSWIELPQTSAAGLFSDPKNPEDYREFEFDLPEASKNISGIFNYTDATGAEYLGYKKYSIKVVMGLESGASALIYPKLNDLRAIALQV